MQPAVSQNTRPLATGARRVEHPRLMLALALVALAGMVVSSISIYHHFASTKTSFCNFGESFNCDMVNRSAYSTVLGVPVALIGVLGYLLILALATVYRDKAETPIMLLLTTVGGLGFALYLTYIEKFVLFTWCILCLSSLALILTAAVLSTVLTANSGRKR
jgi:vitamin-K-epoxide reductase (warfarin-sensitive)